MPYLWSKKRRGEMNTIVQAMVDLKVKADGDLNYILFKYCRYHVEPGYNNYKNFIGEIRQSAAEIERRILNPYEDEKLKTNGDV